MSLARLADLERPEQLALLGLLRLLVRADGTFSPAEVGALQQLAKRLGQAEFWRGMTECQAVLPTVEQVHAAAHLVQRDEARRFVYDCLSEVAASDGIDPREAQLMTWLRQEWALD